MRNLRSKKSLASPFPLHPALRRGSRSAQGLTMIEILVAMLIGVAIMGATVGTMIQVLRMSKTSELVLDAVANARAAMETLSVEMKSIQRIPGATLFVGENNPLSYGNGRDDDGDGQTDEEQPDALDDDNDWAAPASDLHAVIGPGRERRHRVGSADWGDLGVDEDCVFHADRLTFRLLPTEPDPGYAFDIVRYDIREFEGKQNVLVRRNQRYTTPVGPIQTTEAPLAYNVLSFNLLYWMPNDIPEDQYWLEDWNSGVPPAAPGFDLPAALAVEITVYADAKPIEQYTSGNPVDTQTMRTVIALENVIQDAAFPRNP